MAFRQVKGYIFIITSCDELLYNTDFALYFILMLKYLFKPITIPNRIYHLINLIIDVFVEIRYYSKIRRSLTGICGLKACRVETFFQQGLNFVLLILISVFYLYHFKKKNSKINLDFMKLKSNFLDYHYRYPRYHS